MRAIMCLIMLGILSACASGPNLYTPVLSLSDGSQMTESSSADEHITIVRVTRNAERWCKHYYGHELYTVDAMETTYHGILGSAEVARRASTGAHVARRITAGAPVIGTDSPSDWKTVLVFRCKAQYS